MMTVSRRCDAKTLCHLCIIRWCALFDETADLAFLLPLLAFAPLNYIVCGHNTALFAAAFILWDAMIKAIAYLTGWTGVILGVLLDTSLDQ